MISNLLTRIKRTAEAYEKEINVLEAHGEFQYATNTDVILPSAPVDTFVLNDIYSTTSSILALMKEEKE